MPAPEFEETRAEIARRRLADLAASFNATLPDSDHEADRETDEFVDSHKRRWGVSSAHLRFVAVAGAGSLVLVAWWLFAGGIVGGSHDSQALQVSHSQSNSTAKSGTPSASDETPETLIVHVVGKVNTPGIVTVPAGSRLADAIAAAGGTVGKVDLTELNLARKIEDGEQIRVGLPPAFEPTSQGESSSSASGSAGAAPSGTSGKVNLNSASLSELDTLPGVGPVTAQSIVDWRSKNQKFHSVEDLLDIRGIGEATLERLRPLVTV